MPKKGENPEVEALQYRKARPLFYALGVITIVVGVVIMAVGLSLVIAIVIMGVGCIALAVGYGFGMMGDSKELEVNQMRSGGRSALIDLPTAANHQGSGMWFCQSCGNKCQETSLFCDKCGQKKR